MIVLIHFEPLTLCLNGYKLTYSCIAGKQVFAFPASLAKTLPYLGT